MADLKTTGTLLIWVAIVIATAIPIIKHRHVLRWFSTRRHRVDVGTYSFELKYLYGLRNPSGRIILWWTDELDRTHVQTDPRVLVRETVLSSFARIFNGATPPSQEQFTAAVQKHLGTGWLVVSKAEVVYVPVFRFISFCIVHFKVRGTT